MKKLIAILACSIILATVIPVVVLAASNAAAFDKLKLSDVKTYDTALPTKGTRRTLKQMEALWKKVPYMPAGKGTTTHSAFLSFGWERTAPKGNYNYASKMKNWYKEVGKNKFFYYYSEDTNLMRSEGTSCLLFTEDSKYEYWYSWEKGSKEGWFSKNKKININTPPPEDTSIYKVYPDETVLGEKCFVYSWEHMEDNNIYTSYIWRSRKTGVTMKDVTADKNYISTSVYFVHQKEDKKDSFFTPPKIKWIEEKGIISGNQSGMYHPRHP